MFYSNFKQTNVKNLKPWSQHSEGKKKSLFGELNELWWCGSLAHPAGVLINHCQPQRTNLCCCTEPWLMCALGEALKDTQLNNAAQYLGKINLVLNLFPSLILVFWSFDWVRLMDHHSASAIGLKRESRICDSRLCLLHCYIIGADSRVLPTSHIRIWMTRMQPTDFHQ